MIKVSVLYPRTDDSTFDLGYYADNHRGLLRDRLGDHLKNSEIDDVINGPFHAAIHMYFDEIDDFNGPMAEHGAEIMADVPNYTNASPVIVVSNVID